MKKDFLAQLRGLFWCLFAALLALSATRLLLYIFNPALFSLNFTELFVVFWKGLRFDLSALAAYMAPFLFFFFFPIPRQANALKYGILLFFYCLGAFVLIFLNSVDSIYYNFTLKRSTADIFDFIRTGDDTWRLLPQFIVDFWYVLLLCGLLIFALLKVFHRLVPAQLWLSGGAKAFGLQFGALLLTAGLSVLAIRGGFQVKPLRIINSVEAAGVKNAPLVLNTPFTIMKSVGKSTLKVQPYFSAEQLKEIFVPVLEGAESARPQKNVVIIILESFSKEFMGEPYGKEKKTPFLDSLVQEGLFFPHAFANGKKSIDGVPAILAGLPSLMDAPYITSVYANNQLEPLASILSEQGYATSFFHGGKTGTMGFDAFTSLTGYEQYYGMEDFPDDTYFDGNWGIYDQPFFQFFAQQLNQQQQPFLSTFFSLSSHHPYKVQEAYADQFTGARHPLLNTVAYTDMALKEFFATARRMPWYGNTLFVITADHTGQSMNPEAGTLLGNFSIPILLFSPADSTLRGEAKKVVQQIDIQPTLHQYLGIKQPLFSFGRNMLAEGDGYAVNYLNKIYQYVEGEYVLHFDGERSLGFYHFPSDSLLKQNLLGDSAYASKVKRYEDRIKAIVQTYQLALTTNQQTATAYLKE